jgi:eukaryotic-like serine/threonine-protein kinase
VGALLAGTTIANRFHLGHLAGEGGMGAVYRAVDQTTGATVALKVMLDAASDAIERFVREASVLAALDHPSVVRHVAHGRIETGAPFLAMEWLEGEDLAQRLARGPLGPDDSLSVISRIAEALGAVHEHGVVHRDIKPSNIFLRDGDPRQPVLLDFGIARRADATRGLTGTGNVIGTPQYMAPEQVRGEREIGPAADVFALGCVLFECLAGRPAFVGEHAMAVLAKILLEDPPPLRAAPRGLDAAMRAMLHKTASLRPQNGREVVERIARLENAQPEVASNPRGTSLTARERRLINVVLARDPAGDNDRTMTPGDVEAHREQLRREVEALGGQLAPIGTANLVVTVNPAAAAVDQAASAARCAHVLARALPDARVALAMGWAEVEPIPFGEVIDRAAALLAEARPSAIRVDDVSASLLELRFELLETNGVRTLGAERTSTEAPRTLLGRPTPCVGRDRELSVLMGLLGEAASDHVARVALVTANPGVGKSRLRHELAARIAREQPDAAVVVARAEAFRSNASLDMIGQLIRDAAGVREGEKHARARLIARTHDVRAPGYEPGEIAALLGEIASIPFADSASPRLMQARRDNRVIGELMLSAWLAWLGSELQKRPIVLVLEDLHWADPQTIRYIDVALREHAERPLMVLALARPEVRERFPKLWAERSVQEMALPPLNPRAAERLVRGVLPSADDAAIERIVKQAEGNALYLEEMIRAAASGQVVESADTVVAMMQARLQSLEPHARRILRAASVFGESFLVAGVTALAGEDVTRLLSELVEREVLVTERNDAEQLSFRHALLREAAYASLTPEDRQRAHALAAQWLRARGVTDAIVLANHYDLGGDRAEAARAFAEAARQALLKNDFEAAISRADAALARTDEQVVRAAALAARGKAFACIGRHADAHVDLDEALRLGPEMSPAQRTELLEHLWFVGIFRQDVALMRRAGTEAAALARAIDRPALAAEANIALAIADHLEGNCTSAVARFRTSFREVRERPSVVIGLASIILYHAGVYAEAEEVTRKMARVAEDLGDASTQVILESNLGLTLSGLGRYEDADDSFERSCKLAQRFGLTTLLARSVSTSAGYRIDVYDYDEAERRANHAREVGRAIEFATPRVSAAIDLAAIAVRRGELDRALSILSEVREAINHGPGFHGWIWRGRVAVIYAEIFAARGDWQTALWIAQSSIHGFEAVARVKYRLHAEQLAVRALTALGRADEALALARASLTRTREYPNPAIALRAAAAYLDISRDEGVRSELVAAADRVERALPSETAKAAFRRGAPLGRV